MPQSTPDPPWKRQRAAPPAHEPPPPAAEHQSLEVRALIPSEVASRVIGEKGSIIGSIAKATGTYMNISREMWRGSADQVLTVRSKNSGSDVPGAAAEALQLASSELGTDSHSMQATLILPGWLVPLLIGRSGSRVEELQERTGCYISVKLTGSEDEEMFVEGSSGGISAMLEAVCDAQAEEPIPRKPQPPREPPPPPAPREREPPEREPLPRNPMPRDSREPREPQPPREPPPRVAREEKEPLPRKREPREPQAPREPQPPREPPPPRAPAREREPLPRAPPREAAPAAPPWTPPVPPPPAPRTPVPPAPPSRTPAPREAAAGGEVSKEVMDQECYVKMRLPGNLAIGALIGKGGSFMRQLKQESRAQRLHIEEAGDGIWLEIQGTLGEVQAAQTAMFRKVAEASQGHGL